MVTSDLHALLIALASPPGHLDEVCNHEISHTPSGSFKEVSWVRARPTKLLSSPADLPTVKMPTKVVNLGA
jgi:hypothetical protein